MRKFIFITFLVSSLAVIIFAFWLFSRQPSAEQMAKAFPNNAYQTFAQGKNVTLYSLKPGGNIAGAEEFYGYPVLAKTDIKDENLQTLLKRSLLNSMAFPDSAACFNPRHGLRIMSNEQTL